MTELKLLPEVLVKEIKQAFPHPKKMPTSWASSTVSSPDKYCVGGAFLHYATATPLSFPDEDHLSLHFCIYHDNTRSTPCLRHYRLANKLTRVNDDRDFERAWKILEEALSTPCR
jgi:hypothetical protein